MGLALGFVVSGALRGGLLHGWPVCLLSLLTLGQQFRTAGAADRAVLQAIGDSLVSVREYAGLLAVFAFCVGAFCTTPCSSSHGSFPAGCRAFGIVAIILMLTACVSALFSGNRITSYIPLAAPIAVQEIVLGVWLIVKGFNPAAVAALSARQSSLED